MKKIILFFIAIISLGITTAGMANQQTWYSWSFNDSRSDFVPVRVTVSFFSGSTQCYQVTVDQGYGRAHFPSTITFPNEHCPSLTKVGTHFYWPNVPTAPNEMITTKPNCAYTTKIWTSRGGEFMAKTTPSEPVPAHCASSP